MTVINFEDRVRAKEREARVKRLDGKRHVSIGIYADIPSDDPVTEAKTEAEVDEIAGLIEPVLAAKGFDVVFTALPNAEDERSIGYISDKFEEFLAHAVIRRDREAVNDGLWQLFNAERAAERDLWVLGQEQGEDSPAYLTAHAAWEKLDAELYTALNAVMDSPPKPDSRKDVSKS